MCFNHHHTHDAPKQQSLFSRRRAVQTLAAGGGAAALSACVTNPETGSRQFLGLIGEGQLNQMAAASWAEAKKKQKVSTDPRYTRRLRTITSRIARGANKDSEKWDVTVFDDDTKNAFVLPGNRVGFYKGMMDFADNDDQIAAVMGHEVGHVTGRHARERVNQQMLGQVGVAAGTVLGASQLSKKCRSVPAASQRACVSKANQQAARLNQALGLGFMLGIALPYSRNHESQSDLLGAKYMHKAGYDAYQSVRLWEKMAEANPRRQPEFMSTHPDPSRRARDLHDFIKYQEKLGSQGWQSIQLPKRS